MMQVGPTGSSTVIMIVTFHNNRKDLQVTIMCVSKLQSFSLIIMTNPKGKNKKENAAIRHPIQSAKLLHIIILFSMRLYAMFRESYNINTHRLVVLLYLLACPASKLNMTTILPRCCRKALSLCTLTTPSPGTTAGCSGSKILLLLTSRLLGEELHCMLRK